jgi:hypothetical protein
MIALLLAHVLFTTAGYVGLIAASVYLLFVTGSRDANTVAAALIAWRRSARVFGPLLAVGLLFGFGLAMAFHVSLLSTWLAITYVLVIAALGIQGAVMVPWQIRSNRSLAAGVIPPLMPVRLVVTSLAIIYTAIIGLMIARPG